MIHAFWTDGFGLEIRVRNEVSETKTSETLDVSPVTLKFKI